MSKALKIVQTGDRQVNQAQANIAAATSQLRSGPFGDGNLVTGIRFAGGDHQVVDHGLGRAVQGFIVVDQLYTGSDVGAVIVRSNAKQVDPTKQVDLYCSQGPTTAAVWFY